MNRNDVLRDAVDKCLHELYSHVQPSVTWDDFVSQNKAYKEGEAKPYEFYYLPKEVMKEIVDEYVRAYKIENELCRHLDVLITYFEHPTKEQYYVDSEGYKYKRYIDLPSLKSVIGEEVYQKVLEYIQEAKNFYDTNIELNSFNMSVYLGPSPNSSKEAVINNWKKYRNVDITIDDSVYED